MRIAKLFSIGLFLVVLTINLQAQKSNEFLPNEKMGLGITVGQEGVYGVHGNYALSQQLQIGLNFGFYIDGGSTNTQSSTFLLFGPYAKYFFTNIGQVFPFLQGEFQISSYKESYITNQFTTAYRNVTNTAIIINAGGEWFPLKGGKVGVFAGFAFLRWNTSPSQFIVGLGQPFVGVDWFFD